MDDAEHPATPDGVEVTVTAVSIMGGGNFYVPDTIEVEVERFSVLGSRGASLADASGCRRRAAARPRAGIGKRCSGEDPGLLPLELISGDDATVAEVGQLRQLVSGTGR